MKKLLCLSVFFILILTGCEKNSASPAPESLFLLTDDVTEAGVGVGDGAEEFIKAYSDYIIQVIYGSLGSSYTATAASIKKIPFDKEITTIIANFFIDGESLLDETICEENDIDSSQLYTLLSSAEFLRSHEVIYRYLAFDWAGGVITEITSGEMDYNETYETPVIEE